MQMTFNQYIEALIKQMDVTSVEKDDIYDELMEHLQLTKSQYVQSGLDDKHAEMKAMEQFGNPQSIGNEMQEAMFPKRHFLIHLLAYLSIFYTFYLYASQLFGFGDAHFIWLILAIASSIYLWFTAESAVILFRKRAIRVTHYIIHIFLFLYGAMLSDLWPPMAFLALAIVILSIISIYQLAIYDFRHESHEKTVTTIIIHVINITLGIGYIGFTLFFTWGVLVFSTGLEILTAWRFYLFMATLFIWIFSYYLQLKYVHRTKWVWLLFLAPIIYFGIIINL